MTVVIIEEYHVSALYKMLSILLSRYVDGDIGYLQCIFRRNRMNIEHLFLINQIMKRSWNTVLL